MSFYCFKQSLKSLYYIRRHLYFGFAYSSEGVDSCPDCSFANVGIRSLQQKWRHLPADVPQVPSEILLKDKGGSDSLGRDFCLLALFMKSSVSYFHIFLLGITRKEWYGDVCLNTHAQMKLVLFQPLIQLCSGSRKWTRCLKKVEVVLISCCHYSCEYLFRNFSPKMKNSIMRQTGYRVNFSPTLLKNDRYFITFPNNPF